MAENVDIKNKIIGTSECFRNRKEHFNCLPGRIASQVDSNGVFIYEIKRADPSHYVWYTLLANAYLASAGAAMNNFLGFSDPYLIKAAEWALPYVTADSSNVIKGNYIYAAHAYRMIARGTREDKYEQAVCVVLNSINKTSPTAVWSTSKVGTNILNIVMPAYNESISNHCAVWKSMPALHEHEHFIKEARKHKEKFSSRDGSEYNISEAFILQGCFYSSVLVFGYVFGRIIKNLVRRKRY